MNTETKAESNSRGPLLPRRREVLMAGAGLIAAPLLIKPWGPKRPSTRGKLTFPTRGSDGPALDDRNLEPQSR